MRMEADSPFPFLSFFFFLLSCAFILFCFYGAGCTGALRNKINRSDDIQGIRSQCQHVLIRFHNVRGRLRSEELTTRESHSLRLS